MAAPSAQNSSVARTFLKVWSSSEVAAKPDAAERKIAARRILIMGPCLAFLAQAVKPDDERRADIPVRSNPREARHSGQFPSHSTHQTFLRTRMSARQRCCRSARRQGRLPAPQHLYSSNA